MYASISRSPAAVDASSDACAARTHSSARSEVVAAITNAFCASTRAWSSCGVDRSPNCSQSASWLRISLSFPRASSTASTYGAGRSASVAVPTNGMPNPSIGHGTKSRPLSVESRAQVITPLRSSTASLPGVRSRPVMYALRKSGAPASRFVRREPELHYPHGTLSAQRAETANKDGGTTAGKLSLLPFDRSSGTPSCRSRPRNLT